MSHPALRVDTADEIILEAPRLAPALLTVAFMGLAGFIRQWLPGLFIAPWVFGLAALWAASQLLHLHQLKLDLRQRTWQFRQGWRWLPPIFQGTFEDIAGVVIEENEVAMGPLRSRMLLLEFRDWQPPEEGIFALGFPMGPSIAPDRARDYADRLGVPLVDRTQQPAPEPAPESDEPPSD